VSFVLLKYTLPANAEIDVVDDGPVSGTCFRSLVFASLNGPRFRAPLFASPDYRFLTTELLDARPDTGAAARRLRQTAEALAGGSVPVLGADNAPVTLAVFSDFQCPFCARFAATINGLPTGKRDRLRVLYHFFPLPMHKWARSAAEAAACAQRQTGAAFWNLHDWLFAHQKELSVENLSARVLDWARSTPAFDRNEFGVCVERSLASGQVEQDIALGEELGVGGTPTVFLNGDLINDTSPDKIASLIERASAIR
jgi:protein-disulfide isomerase